MQLQHDDHAESLLREQWSTLRSWLDRVDIAAHGDLRSVLPAWTIRELVAHLGYGIELVTAVGPADPGVRPMSIGDYVVQYQPAAPAIAQATKEVAAAMVDVLAGIDAMAEAAWAAVARLDAPVVMARRGPLTKRDYLVTRLVEVVVHADDLHRSLPGSGRSPVLVEPRTVVAQALVDAYRTKSGSAPRMSDPDRWIRSATGRTPSDDVHLPLL